MVTDRCNVVMLKVLLVVEVVASKQPLASAVDACVQRASEGRTVVSDMEKREECVLLRNVGIIDNLSNDVASAFYLIRRLAGG